MEQRLSLITLGVDNLKAAREFYLGGLGWTASSSSTDDATFIPLNGIVLGLWSRTALAEDCGLPLSNDRAGFSGITIAYNARSRDEVDDVMKTAERAGAKILKMPHETFWGGYSSYFADPEGHVWEVAHNPFWDIDAKGNMHLPS